MHISPDKAGSIWKARQPISSQPSTDASAANACRADAGCLASDVYGTELKLSSLFQGCQAARFKSRSCGYQLDKEPRGAVPCINCNVSVLLSWTLCPILAVLASSKGFRQGLVEKNEQPVEVVQEQPGPACRSTGLAWLEQQMSGPPDVS